MSVRVFNRLHEPFFFGLYQPSNVALARSSEPVVFTARQSSDATEDLDSLLLTKHLDLNTLPGGRKAYRASVLKLASYQVELTIRPGTNA